MKPATKRKISIGASIVLALLVFGPIGCNVLLTKLVHSRNEVAVPNVIKLKQADAERIIDTAGLSFSVAGETFDASVPEGSVVSQDPMAGSMVREGREVHVVVSKGGNVITVPDVIGMPQRMAEVMVRNLGLLVAIDGDVYSLYTKKNAVSQQDPAAGAVVDRGAVVHIRISDGFPPAGVLVLPRLVGKTKEQAEALLKQLGITYTITQKTPDITEQVGIVVAQSLPADTTVKPDDQVQITVTAA
jgi:serine/threonine-protein kinase